MPSTQNLPARESWAHPYGIIDPGYSVGLVGAWRFGRPSGMSDAEAYAACTPNKAPLRGVSGPQSAYLFGSPVVQTDYWEFTGGSNYVTSGLMNPQINELDEFCMIAVYKTDQTPINSAATRPFICGWYGQNAGYGSGIVFNAASVVQGVSYETGPIATKTANLSLAGASPQATKWRCTSLSRFAGSLVSENISADGTTNVVTTAMASRAIGGRAFTIGSAWSIYNAGAVGKIHAVLVYDLSATHADLTAPQKAAILAGLRAGAAGTSLASTF